jgi:hypothetical protein
MMFRQVPFMYPDAIVLGVANTIRGHMKLNPAADYRSVRRAQTTRKLRTIWGGGHVCIEHMWNRLQLGSAAEYRSVASEFSHLRNQDTVNHLQLPVT